jgi:hypothetical protein
MGEIQDQVHAEIMARMAQREVEWHERQRLEELLPRGRSRTPGQTMVYSLRLDTDEVAALERRALRLGMEPSVLARNLIRSGVTTPLNAELSGALDRLETAVEGLRALIQ